MFLQNPNNVTSIAFDENFKGDKVEWIFKTLIQNAKLFKDQHLEYEENGIKLQVTCIPDIIERVEWFHDGMHISASYAKVLIERSLNNGTYRET